MTPFVITLVIAATASAVLIIAIHRLARFRLARAKRGSRPVWQTTPSGPYTLIITEEEIACEHPKRPREAIKWGDIKEVRLVTTSDGPWLPDVWYLFVGDSGGCSVPGEAKDFDQIWRVFKERFPGLDYGPIISAGTSDSQATLWRKSETPNHPKPQGGAAGSSGH